MGWVIEKRPAKRLPVLDFEGEATAIVPGAMGFFSARKARRVVVTYHVGVAQHTTELEILVWEPKKRNHTIFSRTAESVACVVLNGRDHDERSIRNCTHNYFTEDMFRYSNRQAAAAQTQTMNSILGYAKKHSDRLLAIELFGLNFFESNYRDDKRPQSLSEIFGDRECLIEEYEQQVKTWKRESEVQA
jgi:hypothetical protein